MSHGPCWGYVAHETLFFTYTNTFSLLSRLLLFDQVASSPPLPSLSLCFQMAFWAPCKQVLWPPPLPTGRHIHLLEPCWHSDISLPPVCQRRPSTHPATHPPTHPHTQKHTRKARRRWCLGHYTHSSKSRPPPRKNSHASYETHTSTQPASPPPVTHTHASYETRGRGLPKRCAPLPPLSLYPPTTAWTRRGGWMGWGRGGGRIRWWWPVLAGWPR